MGSVTQRAVPSTAEIEPCIVSDGFAAMFTSHEKDARPKTGVG